MKKNMILFTAALIAAIPSTSAWAQPSPSTPITVSGVAFADDTGDEDCRVGRGPGYAFYAADAEASADDCDLVAGIQLPQDASMTSLSCLVRDEYTGNAITASLLRVDMITGALDYVFTTNGSVNSSTSQTLIDTTPQAGRDVVDNGRYSYYLAAAFSYASFTSISTLMRIYGCTVTVE